MKTALLVAAGYVLGSMPWGYWLPRLVKRDDIRRHGSGNIGGTNAWRVYGWRLGLPVVLLDTAKGFVPALVAMLMVSHLAGVLAGAAAMLGHWRPLFLRWRRGGKVVATCGGAFLGVAPVVGAVGAVVWLAVFLLFRYASLASIVAALSLPIAAVLL
ncbi:MAG: glycerol-3-phosphate acyltransferase, partial [Gaiellaceae bacterium]